MIHKCRIGMMDTFVFIVSPWFSLVFAWFLLGVHWFFHGVSLVFAWLFVVFHGFLHGFPCFSLVVACFFHCCSSFFISYCSLILIFIGVSIFPICLIVCCWVCMFFLVLAWFS